MADLDPRLNPFRRDVACETLRDVVDSKTYVSPVRKTVIKPVLDLYSEYPSKNGLASQLLSGESFDVFDIQDGIAWGQSVTDNYVGYVPFVGLGDKEAPDTQITAQLAQVYPEPSIKWTPLRTLPFLAKVRAKASAETFVEIEDGFLCLAHTVSIEPTDATSIAERFLGAPYLWGGRSPIGLDCSALIQLAHAALGIDCPRDSDMQMNDFGESIAEDAPVERGDMVFWAGHVGIMQNADTLLHANAHHMKVTSEPLDVVCQRIKDVEGKDVLARKRIKSLPNG